MSEMIFSCPHCEGAVQVDSQYAGQTVACPHCQGGIIVPAAEPAPEADTQTPAPEQPVASDLEIGDVSQNSATEQPVETHTEAPTEQPAAPEPVSEPAPVEEPVKQPPPGEILIEKPTPKPKPKGEPVEAKAGDALITFDCPGCGEELEIPESAIGDPVGCPDCGIEVTNAITAQKAPSGKKKVIVKKKTIKPMR